METSGSADSAVSLTAIAYRPYFPSERFGREDETIGYDVIIAGAGAAGCVLASRLSENPRRRVLLLEAGPDYPDPSRMPLEMLSIATPAYTHDWGYTGSLCGRSLRLPRGRLVGGCSATNAAVALRGAEADYEEWAELAGPAWSFGELLPYFRLLENDRDFDDPWHGRSGPLPIRRTRREDLAPVHRAFLQACREAGFPEAADHNAPGALGAGPVPLNADGGVRQSTALTYLAPARQRPNLTIRGDAMVDRVFFTGDRAISVRLAVSGEEIPGGSVILAAGTYGSPAILMRSGIGPAEHLRAVGIVVREDLDGVGRSLRDHPLLGLRFAAVPPVPQASFAQAVLTLRSSPEISGHDVQILPSSVLATDSGKSPTRAHFMVFASVVKPLSTGRLTLRSTDPADAPLIDPGYFTDPADMPRMIDAVRRARQLTRTLPLSRVSAGELYPGPEATDSDSDLRAAILAKGETYHHAVGTCRMGFAGDPRAVVDATGRVHGTDGLYVVDASVFPIIPAANTHVPVVMAAERCSAWLAEAV